MHMDTKTFARHSFLALVLALGGVACGDDDTDAAGDEGGDTAGENGGENGDTNDGANSDTGGESDAGDNGGEAELKDIVDTAVGAGSFTTLAKLLGDADLVDTLKGEGPFTVFAPTDAAFEKLGAAADGLTKEQLTAVLTYHVVAGKVGSADVKAGPVTTVSGFSAFLSTEGGVKINKATVTTPDIECTNGVIHVIDTVILPPNLVEAAGLAGGFTQLAGALTTAGLVETLTNPAATLTVFAPTDAAFEALPADTVADLTKEQLTGVLTYHVVGSKVLSKDLKAGAVETLNGADVTVNLTGGVKINDATVIIADVVTTNGIIHVIDKVLLPPAE